MNTPEENITRISENEIYVCPVCKNSHPEADTPECERILDILSDCLPKGSIGNKSGNIYPASLKELIPAIKVISLLRSPASLSNPKAALGAAIRILLEDGFEKKSDVIVHLNEVKTYLNENI